jgi:hypothetical protein
VEIVSAPSITSKIAVPVYHVGLTDAEKNELKESNPKLLAASTHFPYLSLKQLTNRLKNAKALWNMTTIEDVSIDGNRKSSDDDDDWAVESFEMVIQDNLKCDFADFWAFFQEIKLADDSRVTGQASELAKFRSDLFEEYKESVWSSPSRDIELGSVTTFHSWMESHSKYGRFYRYALENDISYNAAKALLKPRNINRAREIFDHEEFDSLYAQANASSEESGVEEVKEDSFYANMISQSALFEEKESEEEMKAFERRQKEMLALLKMESAETVVVAPTVSTPEQVESIPEQVEPPQRGHRNRRNERRQVEAPREQNRRIRRNEYAYGQAPECIIDDTDIDTNVHIYHEESGKTNFFIGPMKFNGDFDAEMYADRIKSRVSISVKFVTGCRHFRYIHMSVPNTRKHNLAGYVETCEKIVRVMREIMPAFLDLGSVKTTPQTGEIAEDPLTHLPIDNSIPIVGDCTTRDVEDDDDYGFVFGSREVESKEASVSSAQASSIEDDSKKPKKICSRVNSKLFCEWFKLVYTGKAHQCSTS